MKILEKIRGFVKGHKKLSIFLGVVLVFLLYFFFSLTKAKVNPVRYVLTQVEKGTLITSVSGSGQVAVTNQLDLKPKASGIVTSILVKEGDTVKAGTPIAQIDAKDAVQAVRDAELNLKSAQIALQKLQKPADALSLIEAQNAYADAKRNLETLQKPADATQLLQAQNAVTQAQRTFDQAQNANQQQQLNSTQSLQNSYDDAYNAVSNAFVDLPNIIADLKSVDGDDNHKDATDNVEYYKFLLGNDSAFITTFQNDYPTALTDYNNAFEAFKKTPRTTDQNGLHELINTTSHMADVLSSALEDSRNILDQIADMDYKSSPIASTVDTLRPKIETDIGKINTIVSDLKKAKDTLDTTIQNNPFDTQKAQDAITSAQEQLQEKQQELKDLQDGAKPEDIAAAQEKVDQTKAALAKLQEGADPLDVQSQQLTIQQRENALADAQANLDDYTLKAPFDGIIAKISAQKGDTATSGTAAVTMITKDFLAQVSLNEVDAAKVALGNKATLTFDALSDLNIAGEVAQIDLIGTVSQGVVNYNAKIAFDTTDPRVKPGMSVSAAIITQVKQDALLVPNSAVKTQGDVHYVEYFDSSAKLNRDSQSATTVTSNVLPQPKEVQVGLSNDTQTEITDGVQEGDEVISQTLSGTSASRTQGQNATGLRIPGLGGGGAGGGAGGGNAVFRAGRGG